MTFFCSTPTLTLQKTVFTNCFRSPVAATFDNAKIGVSVFTRSVLYCQFSSLVVALRKAICPDTVLGAIALIVVDPFNGKTFRSCPHVSDKVLKSIPPSADFNSTSAIVFIRSVSQIITSSLHILPAKIFRCWCTIYTSAVSFARRFYNFSRSASARGRKAGSKSGCSWSRFVTTATHAFPLNVAIVVTPRQFNHKQSSERFARKINMTSISHEFSITQKHGSTNGY